jgi:hypothetical protein
LQTLRQAVGAPLDVIRIHSEVDKAESLCPFEIDGEAMTMVIGVRSPHRVTPICRNCSVGQLYLRYDC